MNKKNETNCCSGLSNFLPVKLFKALSDPNRLTILERLVESGTAQTVSQVSACCPVNISVVSRHLALLRDAGILQAEKKGKEVYYRVRVKPFTTWLRELAAALETCCPDGECTIQGEENGLFQHK
ncbi:MAG: helix-turn-helix transcriptional regulator [Proteobacteria bacterium]|nr:helix-turn-helix transcriptional regulator [Pseudomonadota bacterium]